tara:strand:+ start:342 stop:1466 length:1125 start_codon:yes stop_codon:yes gene_type:complete
MSIIGRSKKTRISSMQKIFSINLNLLIPIILIGIISCFAMYSTDAGTFGYHTQSHIIRLGVFLIVFFLVSLVRFSFWHKSSTLIYFIVLILLFGVEFFGVSSSGSKRWINLFFINLQPSELMKIALILFLSNYYHKLSPADVNKIRFFLIPIVVIIIPVFLVISQPDLGTSVLIAATGLIMLWLAGIRAKYYVYSLIIFVTALPFVIAFLKPYQKLRILTFLNPDKDPTGAGYQIIQSKIAVGSGGFFGKGYLKGTQSYLDYLPEKHTDFIFTLYAEEFGFLGCILLLSLFLYLIMAITSIGNRAREAFAKLYCYGLATALFVYITVNMSMVLGLLPIVGSPLPIMSYGGSAMLSVMFGLGIVMSCHIHKDEGF